MSDLGVNERMPVPYEEPKETKSMKKLWVQGRIHEMEKQICNFKRQLEGAELTLKSLQEAKQRLEKSIDA